MAATDNPCPHWYRVCLNTIVRKGVKLDSERMRILPMGSRVHVVEVQDRRVQIDQPINGWCSLRSSNGDTILTPLNDDGPSETPKADAYKTRAKSLQEKEENLKQQQKETQADFDEVKKNPKTAELLSQMNDLKNKLNFHKNLLASQDKLKLDFEELLKQKNEQNSQNETRRQEFEQLLQIKSQLTEVAKQEGLSDPLQLQQHLSDIKKKQTQNLQSLETYKTLAAAAEKELDTMKKQMAELMADPMSEFKLADDYRNGDVVQIKGGVGIAIVRFCGKVDANDADNATTYVGVEFENDVGDSNGTVEGREYFRCLDNHGQFFPISDVAKQITAAQLLNKLNIVVQKYAKQSKNLHLIQTEKTEE